MYWRSVEYMNVSFVQILVKFLWFLSLYPVMILRQFRYCYVGVS